jgi:hypothetical protein
MASVRRVTQRSDRPGALPRALGLVYAWAGFVIALALFLYAVLFLINLRFLGRPAVAPSIDVGPSSSLTLAVLTDLA